jgi:hypothetical protein
VYAKISDLMVMPLQERQDVLFCLYCHYTSCFTNFRLLF